MSNEPHVQRVIDERQQLLDRLTALGNFIDGPVYQTLGVLDQVDLQRQHEVMTELNVILSRRIRRMASPGN